MKGLLPGLGLLAALWLASPEVPPGPAPQEPPAKEEPPPAPDQEPPAKEEPPPAPDQEPPAKKEPPPAPGQEPPAEEEPPPAPGQEPPAEEEPPPAPGQEPPAEEEPPVPEGKKGESFDFDTEAVMFVIKKGERPQVRDILMAISKFTGRTVVPTDQLKIDKEINIIGPAELTYPLLRIVLEVNDVKLVHQKTKDGRELIKALGGTPRELTGKVGGPTPVEKEWVDRPDVPEMLTRIFRMKHADGSSLNNTLRAIKRQTPSDPGVFQHDPWTNAFIIRDIKANVDYLVEILEALDIPAEGRKFRAITLEQASADAVAQIIESVLLGRGVRRVPGRPVRRQPGRPVSPQAAGQSEPPQVVADSRTNKLIIYALPEDMVQVEELVRELDVRVPYREGKLHHFQLQNTQAEEIAGVLNEVISGTRLQQPGGPAGGVSPGMRSPQVPRTAGQFQQMTGVGEVATRIVADPQTNSLIIQAEPDIYEDILALIEKLDQKKNQIFIEAQIWEVGMDDTLNLGVELTSLDRPVPGKTRGGGITNFGLTTIQVDDPANPTTFVRAPLITEGLTTFILQGAFDRVPIVLNALSRSTNARILSTPFAITNDNSEATFTITDTVPFQTSTVAGTGLAQGGFSFANATTTLQIKPTISSEDRLQLQVVVDIQTFTGTALGGAPPPSNSRRYEGTITVPNRKYVVVGGLEQEEAVEEVKKVPLLGDIPLIGLIFQSRQTIKRRTRIFFFIKPTIFTEGDFSRFKRASSRLQRGLKKFSPFDYEGEVIREDELSTREVLGRLFEEGKVFKLGRKK